MKKSAPLFLAGFLVAFATVTAESAPRENGSSPSVDKIIKMEIYVPAGRWIKVSVLEGEEARVHDSQLGLELAFRPVRQREGFRVDVFRIGRRATGEPAVQFVEDLLADLGEIAYTKRASSSFGVRVVDVVEPLDLNSQLGPTPKDSCLPGKKGVETFGTALPTGKQCCVTCGGEKTCGCAADDWCGSCCSGPCCSLPRV